MSSRDLERFISLLPTLEHRRAVPLYDSLIKDPLNAGPILDALLYTASSHDDPQLHTPHGLLTAWSARELLGLTRPPGGLPLLRFLVLYNFSLKKSPLKPSQAEAAAQAVPRADLEELSLAYRRALEKNLASQAGALLSRVALDHGLQAAGHLAVRASLDDLGRLGHNLVMAIAYVQTAEAVGLPRAFLPLMSLARVQASALSRVPPAAIPERFDQGSGEPDVARLNDLVVEGAFDHVEAVLQALVFRGMAEEAYRPLLIATGADPGFLGHTLQLVHCARLGTRYLTPSENVWLAWKLYRTLTGRFGYPEFFRMGRPVVAESDSVLAALESSLRYKSPPAEATVRQALEAGVPLERILAKVVDAYGLWTVGEKEHTISYLNAALQTAKFLGTEQALLPLAIALGKLPF
ncbi:MAG TPA: hypothetical protein VIB49_06755 [Thermoplasmata archaeon]|jgi:hypothetical protein